MQNLFIGYQRNSPSIVCAVCKNFSIHSSCVSSPKQSKPLTKWKCDECPGLSSLSILLLNSEIDQILENVNATNFELDSLVEENKLLRDRLSILENKIKYLEFTSTAKNNLDPVT